VRGPCQRQPPFQQQFRKVKHHNKIALARLIAERINIVVDPSALFDVQIKRIHEYKRQLLNILETIALYQAMKDDPQANWVAAVKIFAGKAAASYPILISSSGQPFQERKRTSSRYRSRRARCARPGRAGA